MLFSLGLPQLAAAARVEKAAFEACTSPSPTEIAGENSYLACITRLSFALQEHKFRSLRDSLLAPCSKVSTNNVAALADEQLRSLCRLNLTEIEKSLNVF
jgi:hypothetical protein